MTKRILCSVDGSEHALEAVRVAAGLATATGAQLVIVAINELVGGHGRGGISNYIWTDAEADSVLQTAAEEARASGVVNPDVAKVNSRDVARAIIVYAEEHGVDHIVVGSSGKGGFKRLMLGSVSREVTDRAHCPVTIVRGP
ncbi:MAG: transcriptional regulator [Hyphomicrobium sp. 32-62-53]|nr:MAG: transcriptional regulator [Hyphomicrobium sp. 12-62-95]OYX97883.1 MAG: transcriptional regulator [Hyphomicrobium sp. 32-62-53]